MPVDEKSAQAPREQSRGIMAESRTNSEPLPVSKRGRLLSHLTEDIRSSSFAESQLVFLTFCTGMQDATTFPDYHCFASNQTGNTVFLCLALILPQLDGEAFITSNIGMALGLFLGAGWLTGQLSHTIGPRKRWWLLVCNLIQSGMVLGAAAVQYRYGIKDRGPKALTVVGLLAFAAGSQVVQSRSLCLTEMYSLRGNIKDSHEYEVADWQPDDEVSNYNTFTVPYGQGFPWRLQRGLI
ncbi:DUF1275 domain protein [Ophiocordyceps sinensis CO18]|uniref:DUF1275 domain protein n=1 Tax=Ophiocordyceps sinensis (strain Co18 / CGMCC 3.14243) TaxID=911162 RepID=T5A9W4_OPHSC|nr:DUF1275 domain protein [Ophiocordyceps sinensis CO18]